MMKFKTFISEGNYPNWVKITVATIVYKIRNLSKRIEREKDPVKQNRLIAQQNKLISYIDGLGIAINTDDEALLKKLKSYGRI